MTKELIFTELNLTDVQSNKLLYAIKSKVILVTGRTVEDRGPLISEIKKLSDRVSAWKYSDLQKSRGADNEQRFDC